MMCGWLDQEPRGKEMSPELVLTLTEAAVLASGMVDSPTCLPTTSG